MSHKLLPLIALLLFIAAPIVIGSAEQTVKENAPAAVASATPASPSSPSQASADKAGEKVTDKSAEKITETPVKKKASNECLASEEVIQDLEMREKRLNEREESLKEKEKQLSAQSTAIKDELKKLEEKQVEIQGVHQKEMANREEQVNKLIETFEGMSPKSAAQVISGVDDELAVMALSKLTSVKAGKILSNLKSDKSARLSEMMAYGKVPNRKESARGDSSERSPAGQ